MSNGSSIVIEEVVGLDLGDKQSHLCVLDMDSGEVLERARIPTTPTALERRFSTDKPMRIALETGTHSPWVAELLESLGHEVLVANPRKVPSISRNNQKTDEADAEHLARLARVDPKLLEPIQHRGREARVDLGVLRSRDALVRARTQLINHARGIVKAAGGRLPSCDTASFGTRRMAEHVSEDLKPAVLPILEMIDGLTAKIRSLDREIERMAEEKYPVAMHLMEIGGVGPLTSMAFVLTLEDPGRFKKSRSVGPYLGLSPGKDQSGDDDPQKRITKAGDAFLRRLLVNASHYIIGPFGPDCDLRRHGLKIASRGGKNGKKRATIAVARKLAVLMHRLWVTGEVYDPLYNARKHSPDTEAQTTE